MRNLKKGRLMNIVINARPCASFMMVIALIAKNRIDIMIKDTKSPINRMSILLVNERDEPLYLIYDGKIFKMSEYAFDINL